MTFLFVEKPRIIHPENTSRLPSHMSLTAKLLSSPRALQRIHNFIHGRPAYIIPGIAGDEDITLSVKLNIPLLAPHPHHRHAVMIRSGARAVFKTAEVMTAPSHIFPRVNHSNVDIKTSPLKAGILIVSQFLCMLTDRNGPQLCTLCIERIYCPIV